MKKSGGMPFVAGLESTNVTLTYVLLARIQSCDHTQLQGMLGNVVQGKKMVGGNIQQSSPQWVCICRCLGGQWNEWEGLSQWEGASGLAVFLTFGPAVSDKTYISHHDPGGIHTHTHLKQSFVEHLAEPPLSHSICFFNFPSFVSVMVETHYTDFIIAQIFQLTI